jgi:hypothetical protein
MCRKRTIDSIKFMVLSGHSGESAKTSIAFRYNDQFDLKTASEFPGDILNSLSSSHYKISKYMPVYRRVFLIHMPIRSGSGSTIRRFGASAYVMVSPHDLLFGSSGPVSVQFKGRTIKFNHFTFVTTIMYCAKTAILRHHNFKACDWSDFISNEGNDHGNMICDSTLMYTKCRAKKQWEHMWVILYRIWLSAYAYAYPCLLA